MLLRTPVARAFGLCCLFFIILVDSVGYAVDGIEHNTLKDSFDSTVPSPTTPTVYLNPSQERVKLESGSSSRRHVLQRQSQSGSENETPCRLSEDDVRQFYNQSSGQWLVTDEVLDAVSSDVQSIIECAQEDDTLLFSTNSIVTPARTLNVTKNLTLGSQDEPNLVDNERQITTSEVARFTCPESGQLITSSSPIFTLHNIAIEGCNSSSSIIELDTDCEGRPLERIRFRHLVIEGNTLTGEARIVDSRSPMCFHLELDDIRIVHNLCTGDSCLFLSSRNILNNIHLINNTGGRDISPQISVFPAREGSQIIATNITSEGNQIRSFYLSDSSLDIIDSNFYNNKWNQASATTETSVGGGAIYSRNSTVSISTSAFEGGYAYNGGAICATRHSNLSISQSHFTRNEASLGGVIFMYFECNASVFNCTFASNKAAEVGGSLYAIQDCVLTLSNSNASNNEADQGGSLYLQGASVAQVSYCIFTNHRAYTSGSVIHLEDRPNITLLSSTLHENLALSGGAIYMRKSIHGVVIDCNFTTNIATNDGGVIYLRDGSTISLLSTRLNDNSARNGGVIYIFDSSNVTVSNSNFTNNKATEYGGAFFMVEQSIVTIFDSAISGNEALYGGAIRLLNSMLFTQSVALNSNRATLGGAISCLNATLNINLSTFEANHAQEVGGALYMEESNATLENTIMHLNEAKEDCGGICAMEVSHLEASNLSVGSNIAGNEGGGICVGNGSSILCYSCVMANNRADSGAGMFIYSNNSILVVAQLQDSRFENNSAQSFGGGLVLNQRSNTSTNCNSSSITCGHIILLNTNFKDNYANHTGAAILTSIASGILLDCEYRRERTESFINQSDFRSLESLNPSLRCPKWTGNRLSSDEYGDIVGTYAEEIVLHIAPDDEVRLIGNTSDEYVLKNVRGGKRIPTIYVTLLDGFGVGPAPTFPHVFEARLSSPDNLLRGIYPASISAGSGNFSDVAAFARPGNYTVEIKSDNVALETLSMFVIVRECQIGEEPTSDRLTCQDCDAISYNFNPSEDGGCTQCPNGGNCSGRYIIPQKGYWHKSPCHDTVKECLIEEACSYDNRSDALMKFTNNYTDCNTNETELEPYNEALCNKGYKGLLCGSCQNSYGLSATFECLRCPSTIISLLIIIGIVAYLLCASAFTIRGCLPLNSTHQHGPSSSNRSSTSLRRSNRDPQMNVEMVKMLVEGHVPKEYLERRQSANVHCSQSQTSTIEKENEYELTRWRTTEIFKIMINFLQTIAVAANVNVQWTDGMRNLFKSAIYIGALATTAVSRPIDCIVPSSASRAIWRMLVSLFVPGVVMGIFCIFWGVVAIKKSANWRYFLKRVVLSTISVTYISYLGLTRMAVRGFYCIDIYDSYHYLKHSTNRFWAIDTSIRCYGKEHSGIMTISIVVLIIVTICFPLFSSIVLFRRKESLGRRDIWIFETGGFLFRAFKEKFAFWESVVMFRKACLSVIIVFSYPLGGDSQGLLASVLLLFSLYVHLSLRPYKNEFKTLNHFESCSLLVSSLTFTLGLFFVNGRCSDSVRTFLAVLLLFGNIMFFLFLFFAFFYNSMVHFRVALQCENIPLPDPPTWWNVLKLYIRSRLAKICQ